MKKALVISVGLLAYATSVFGQKVILPDFHADPSARVFGQRLYTHPTTPRAHAIGKAWWIGTFSPRTTW